MITRPRSANKPWYRHPWPWLLMAGPFIVVVAGLITAYLAVRSNDGLVDDDYYKQGLAVNQMNARDQRATALAFQAEVMRGADGLQVRVLLRAAPGAALPQTLRLRFVHPTRPGIDQAVALAADGAGSYAGKLGTPLSGRWHVVLEDEKDEWRLTGDWMVDKNAVLSLPAVPQGGAKTG
jgi:hypothetical protein